MMIRLRLSIIFAIFTVCGYGQTSNFASVYTSLTQKDCKTIEMDEEAAGWYRGLCSGVSGFSIEVTEGDLRQSLIIVTPDQRKFDLDLTQKVSPAFSFLGEKAEWRIRKERGKTKPIALIVRYSASEDPENPERKSSYLVIAKITPNEICLTDIIQPTVSGQNEQARRMADAASGRPCRSDKSF